MRFHLKKRLHFHDIPQGNNPILAPQQNQRPAPLQTRQRTRQSLAEHRQPRVHVHNLEEPVHSAGRQRLIVRPVIYCRYSRLVAREFPFQLEFFDFPDVEFSVVRSNCEMPVFTAKNKCEVSGWRNNNADTTCRSSSR